MRISGKVFSLREYYLTIVFHLQILRAFIINQFPIFFVLCFFFFPAEKGKTDLLSNKELPDSCVKESCPVSPPKSVPGKCFDSN